MLVELCVCVWGNGELQNWPHIADHLQSSKYTIEVFLPFRELIPVLHPVIVNVYGTSRHFLVICT